MRIMVWLGQKTEENTSPKVKANIGAVLVEIFKDDASKYQDIIDTIRKDSRASIDDFGNMKQYVDLGCWF